MSSSIFKQKSQISTGIRCNNCDISIINIRWKQCKICQKFIICKECDEKYQNDKSTHCLMATHIEFHEKIHDKNLISNDCMQLIPFSTLSNDLEAVNQQLSSITEEKKIQNDNDMSIVLSTLKQMKNPQSKSEQELKQQLCSMIVDYHIRASDIKIRILSLDGGGIRGYMPIKIIQQLITEKYLTHIEQFNSNDLEHREQFKQAQTHFTKHFDYFVGTSTSGLVAFCLSIGYDILDLKDIYSRASYYFNRNYFGPLLSAKYNSSRIHKKIDDIIGTITLKNGKKLSAENATLLDIHNYLNPDVIISDDILKSAYIHDENFLEFTDNISNTIKEDNEFNLVKREKVLLITAYNATKNIITVFNTSYAEHWPYRIADVLKATMAAPTYFPPQKMSTGKIENGHFIPNKNSSEIFVDGGIFANDPELIALWAIQMQWKKLINYHILSIGAGVYNTPILSSKLGGYCGWLVKNGLLINMLMDATRSLTEVISRNLHQFKNMKRMKFNFKLKEAISLDDTNFVKQFDEEWEYYKNGNDFKTLMYFYNKYIAEEDN